MALAKEIWINSIVENLFPDDSFITKSINDSGFVNYKKVHIPNAGSPSGIQKNRETKPATIKTRTDTDLEYTLDEFTTDPISITNADIVELSYDKRNSIIANDRAQLQKAVSEAVMQAWAGSAGNVVETSGEDRAVHTGGKATGNRKKITKKNVHELATQFDVDDIPFADRYLLLDAIMYNDLIDDMTAKELTAFQMNADVKTGVMGDLYGFKIMKRSRVLRVDSKKAVLDWGSDTGATTDCAAGLAWQASCVSHALGDVKMFDEIDSPTMYGDIYSFLVRAGGSIRRNDKKGIALIAEATATA